ncbi:MAG: peptidylprolyl isomerase [Gammaproteobacteria bacterium]|nr:peptidylprolyl isomerase [Gammaproteobacteria bacterium]MBU2478234.1 peptidylprolyl isomerase [Gammaproteobacteria bacterium]
MRHSNLFSTMAILVGSSLLCGTALGNTVVRMETSAGDIYVELYDDTAPITVTNFLNYVRDGDYDNSFIHRSAISPLIIQGGGYIYENNAYSRVPADAAIVNEYGADRPNERGTISMARTSAPDSATSEWFFNIADNSVTLGPQNTGGYAVFGRVLGSNNDAITSNDGNSMAAVDAIASLDRFNGINIDATLGGAWTEIPLIGFAAGQTYDPMQNLVRVVRITETNQLQRTTSFAGNSITLTTPTTITLSNIITSDTPDASTMPAGVQFSEGFFSFNIGGLTPGEATSIAMELPEDFQPNTYYMYGPTPDNASPHWYEFKYNGSTGAEFFGNNYVVLHFIDGQRGDADLLANGTITDPGAPGISAISSSSSNGGGCTLSRNSSSTPMSLDFGLLILIMLIHRAYKLTHP